MPEITLHSPEITCEHCIATIEEAVNELSGARFLRGDPDRKQFVVEIERSGVLDEVASTLLERGYPLGESPAAVGVAGRAAPDDWRPEYRVTRSDAGAHVNYDCPCSCDAGFAFDRSQAEQAAESCCCGRRMIVGTDAEARLRAAVDAPDAYWIDVQEIAMPWGQPLPAALAIPRDGGEHGDG